jgi:repressor LexA
LTKLTRKQHTVLEYIQRYLAEHRQSPFIREIQTGCQIASYKSTIDRLNALERKGFIKRAPNKHRGITLPRKALELVKVQTDAVAAQSAAQNDSVGSPA